MLFYYERLARVIKNHPLNKFLRNKMFLINIKLNPPVDFS